MDAVANPTKMILSPVQQDPIAVAIAQNPVSIIDLVAAIVRTAFQRNVSDIHLDPNKSEITVRFRIDGALEDAYSLPKRLQSELLTRLKILTGLRTDEHFSPHDGRFRFPIDKEQFIDIRVSIIPTYYGENAVLRLLAPFQNASTINDLGFSETQIRIIDQALAKPHGMILITGPTGSGKTTTLYALIQRINARTRSIITIEDPIEYSIQGINQIQINSKTGLSFAQGLRSILRQDPNTIMIGEIRDSETATLAVNASLTGHLVLSTLHANDSVTTLPRLLDMGVEAYLAASTISLVIAQRLVRRICSSCESTHVPTGIERQALSEILLPEEGLSGEFFHGHGCGECGHTGYRGRIGVYELLPIEGVVRDAMGSKRSAANLRSLAIKNGMTPMVMDGYEKALAGITTLEEVLRVRYE